MYESEGSERAMREEKKKDGCVPAAAPSLFHAAGMVFRVAVALTATTACCGEERAGAIWGRQ